MKNKERRRDAEVLALLGEGLTPKAAARQSGKSLSVVYKVRRNAYRDAKRPKL